LTRHVAKKCKWNALWIFHGNTSNINWIAESEIIKYIYIYLIAIGLTPGGSSAAHIYTHTVDRIQVTEKYKTIKKLNFHNSKNLKRKN
jgi:hypothetical protein